MINEVYAMAQSPQGAASQQGGVLGSFVPLIFIFVIFYFLLIRPQQKKMKEHQNALNTLKKGDQVITSGGMHGVVMSLKGNEVELKIAENVIVLFSKHAISTIIKEEQDKETSN